MTRRRLRYSTTFLPHSSLVTTHSPGADGSQGGNSEIIAPPTISEDQVRDCLRNLNHKTMGADEMHPS